MDKMVTYAKPQVQVFQNITTRPSAVPNRLLACVIGPNVVPHRFHVLTERDEIVAGPYNHEAVGTHLWPTRSPGGIVDPDSVKLFVENALLHYFEDLAGEDTHGGAVLPVGGRKNRVRHTSLNFHTNGTNPASSVFGDREVQIGDVVYLRGVTEDDNCDVTELWTEVAGFAAESIASVIYPATIDPANADDSIADEDAVFVSGTDNGIDISDVDGSGYNGLAAGILSESYRIEVIRSGVSGCSSARLRITSGSGTDDVDEVEVPDFAVPFEVGTRGLLVTFADTSIGSDAEFVTGQTWDVSVTQAYEAVCPVAGTTYNGPYDDTYIIEVTKGGLWAESPEITVTTTRGLDSSGPTIVTASNLAVAVGTAGLTVRFVPCGANGSLPQDPIIDTIIGLTAGDRFYVRVESSQSGPIQQLILRDDLSAKMQASGALDMRLFLSRTIEVTENRLSNPPLKNFDVELTQIVTQPGITTYVPEWTVGGTMVALPIWSGFESSATSPVARSILYVEYHEWVSTLVGSVGKAITIADLSDIPGPLDEINELKWGVYRAIQNANGSGVAYIAVADPRSLDAWQNTLDRLSGRDDVYNFVPLTFEREIVNLFAAQATAESGPEAGNWKAVITALRGRTTKLVVGESTAEAQSTHPTSLDGSVVLATVEDNPEATGVQYTLLSVPAGNAGFLTYGVTAGDTVRFLYTINAFGDSSYQSFTVDSVLSESTLLLTTSANAAVSVPQKMEVWRMLSTAEMVDDIVDQAGGYSDSRVVATWPDIVGTAGNNQHGYFLSAAIGGLISGVPAQQGLTNVEINGFDDVASRTSDLFSSAQLDRLAAGGVWLVVEDRNGTPHTRHAVTTSTIDLNRREESLRRNLDAISYVFLRRLRPYIGSTNVTPSMLKALEYEIRQVIKALRTNAPSPQLGPQLISAEVAVDEQGNKLLRQHPLAADRVEIVLNLVLPAPLNYLELHLVV